MSQFMLLIYGPAEGGPSPAELEAEMPRWFEYTEALRAAGALVAGDALHPAASASTVRLRSGVRQVSDGPFAETSEALGGYYVIDVADRAAAEDWAARIPNASYGSTEVREIVVFPETSPEAATQATA